MRLKILAPAKVVLDQEASKVVARNPDGYFCLLPHHVDYVSELAPGILTFTDGRDCEHTLAIDEAVLVKRGDEVLVATRNAIQEPHGEQILPDQVTALLAVDAEEAACRQVIAGLEKEFMDGFLKDTRDG